MEKAKLTCPHCNHVMEVDIPESSCLVFHICEHCKKLITVPQNSENCCVICEYADRKCPAPHVK